MPWPSNISPAHTNHGGGAKTKFKANFPFWIFPLIGAAVWLSMLWSLMIIWLSQRQPRYSHMNINQRVAYISDIGANVLKPFFIAGCTVTAVMFSASLFSVRHNHAFIGEVEKLCDNISIGAGVASSLGLISLSVFDLARYHNLHFFCLLVFMIGVTLSAVSTLYEYSHLRRNFEDFRILRMIYVVKLIIVVVEVTLTILLAGSMFGRWHNYATCTEWAGAYLYTFYLLSYFFDLGPTARTKDQGDLLRELNIRRSSRLGSDLLHTNTAETTDQEN